MESRFQNPEKFCLWRRIRSASLISGLSIRIIRYSFCLMKNYQTPSLLTFSHFPLFLHWRSPLPFYLLFLFPSSQFLELCSCKYLILQPKFYRLPRVRHSIRSHSFSSSLFSVLFPFVCSIFISCFLFFGCICFQCFPCYYKFFLHPLRMRGFQFFRFISLFCPTPFSLRASQFYSCRVSTWICFTSMLLFPLGFEGTCYYKWLHSHVSVIVWLMLSLLFLAKSTGFVLYKCVLWLQSRSLFAAIFVTFLCREFYLVMRANLY